MGAIMASGTYKLSTDRKYAVELIEPIIYVDINRPVVLSDGTVEKSKHGVVWIKGPAKPEVYTMAELIEKGYAEANVNHYYPAECTPEEMVRLNLPSIKPDDVTKNGKGKVKVYYLKAEEGEAALADSDTTHNFYRMDGAWKPEKTNAEYDAETLGPVRAELAATKAQLTKDLNDLSDKVDTDMAALRSDMNAADSAIMAQVSAVNGLASNNRARLDAVNIQIANAYTNISFLDEKRISLEEAVSSLNSIVAALEALAATLTAPPPPEPEPEPVP